jgi:hypothetical protein
MTVGLLQLELLVYVFKAELKLRIASPFWPTVHDQAWLCYHRLVTLSSTGKILD